MTIEAHNLFQIADVIIVLASFKSLHSILKSNDQTLNNSVIALHTIKFTLFILAVLNLYEILFPLVPLETSGLTDTLLQFIGTILAIFFSIALVPLQMIVENTTYAVTTNVKKNKLIREAVFLFLFIFAITAFQSIFPLTKPIVVLQALYLILTIPIFLIVVMETLRLMDINNVVRDFRDEALRNLREKWAPALQEITDIQTQLRQFIMVKNLLLQDIKPIVEHIYIISKKHLERDQVEVVLVALDSIKEVTLEYLKLLRFSFEDNDKLFGYIVERFIDLKTSMKKTTHYSVMPAIIEVTKAIALEALEIETFYTRTNQSLYPLALVEHLKEIALSDFLLKSTTPAPIDAVNALEMVGIKAVQKDNLFLATTILEKLSEISCFCINLNIFYPDHVAKEANKAMMNIHSEILKNQNTHQVIIGQLAEYISRPIETFALKRKNPTIQEQGILSPIIGMGIDPLGIGDLTSIRTFRPVDALVFKLLYEENAEQDIVFEYIERVFQKLNRVLLDSKDNRLLYLDKEIVESAYGTGFTLMCFMWENKITDTESVKELLDDRLYYIFSNAVSLALEKKDINFTDKVERWISLLGLYLIVFNTWEGFPSKTLEFFRSKIGSEIRRAFVKHEGKLYPKHEILGDLKILYNYLSLLLLWEKKIVQNEIIANLTFNMLCKYEGILRGRNVYGNRHYIPHSHLGLGEEWTLMQPHCPGLSLALDDFRSLLNTSRNDEYAIQNLLSPTKARQRLTSKLKEISNINQNLLNMLNLITKLKQSE